MIPLRASRSVILIGIGVATSTVVAVLGDIPASDALTLIALSFGVASATYLAGVRGIRIASQRIGLTTAALATASIPLVATALGMIAAALAMFVSAHDLSVLFVIVTGAGTAGAFGAAALGSELASARRGADAARERELMVEQARRELVAWVSHDLRTPLAAIRAMVEALDDHIVVDEPTVERYHHQIGAEVERLSRLVDDLFELARLQADAVTLDLERVSLVDLVSDAVASVHALASAKGVRVDGAIGDDHPEVAASPRDLTRVVHNLIDNAIRHTPTGGAVAIEVMQADGEAVVSVADRCGGLAPEDLDRVFELAYRGGGTESSGGGGLGLAIARGLVEAHAGDIDVVNENDGCRFTVRLPLA